MDEIRILPRLRLISMTFLIICDTLIKHKRFFSLSKRFLTKTVYHILLSQGVKKQKRIKKMFDDSQTEMFCKSVKTLTNSSDSLDIIERHLYDGFRNGYSYSERWREQGPTKPSNRPT